MSRGKGKATRDLVELAAAILAEIQPASVRAVCYRLFAAGAIGSMGKNETAKVSRALVWAREKGMIPWAWIVDETRGVERTPAWDDPESLLSAAVYQYRKDYWQDQPLRIEVWSEKGTVRGTLKPVLDKYGVAFRVMHGFGSATALHDAAEATTYANKGTVVLYVGDRDPSGRYMAEVDIQDRLERYDGDADIVQVALLGSDCTGLPSFDVGTKRGDPRQALYIRHYGTRCWELDALPPPILRQRVQDEIVARLDVASWQRMRDVERAECESMGSFLADWRKLHLDANCDQGATQ